MALSDAIEEVRALLATVTGIDRAYESAPHAINEPGIVALVELEEFRPYFTLDGLSHQVILRLQFVKGNPNPEDTRREFYDLAASVATVFRTNRPENADYWKLLPSIEWGTFPLNDTESLYGFSQQLELVGNF